jgi:hypothetical protein
MYFFLFLNIKSSILIKTISRRLISLYLLPDCGAVKRAPLHRACSRPGKALPEHASDAPKPEGKGAPTIVRFWDRNLPV